jgi:hypothetical protein
MEESVKAEWIPAHLNYDGPAKVAEYFDSRISEGDDGRMIGFFPIPDGYDPCVVSIEGDRVEKIRDLTQIRIWE